MEADYCPARGCFPHEGGFATLQNVKACRGLSLSKENAAFTTRDCLGSISQRLNQFAVCCERITIQRRSSFLDARTSNEVGQHRISIRRLSHCLSFGQVIPVTTQADAHNATAR